MRQISPLAPARGAERDFVQLPLVLARQRFDDERVDDHAVMLRALKDSYGPRWRPIIGTWATGTQKVVQRGRRDVPAEVRADMRRMGVRLAAAHELAYPKEAVNHTPSERPVPEGGEAPHQAH